MSNFRELYRKSDEYMRAFQIALIIAFLGSVVLSVFLSTALAIGLVLAAIAVFFALYQPVWTLAALLMYLPFEPFLLKWIPDDVYIYARFFSEAIIYLLVASTLVRVFLRSKTLLSTKVDLPLVLFVLTIIASIVINTIAPFDAALGARQLLRFVLLFFIVTTLRPDIFWLKRLITGLVLVVVIQAVLGYGQFLVGAPLDNLLLPSESRTFGEIQITEGTVQFWDPGQRVFGTLGRYDRLGTFLAIILLIAASVLYEKNLNNYHRGASLLLLSALPILALTYSRSAWFGFLLGFFFIALFIKKDRRILTATVVVAILLAIYLSVSGLVVNRLIDTSSQTISERFFEAFSFERWRGEYVDLGRLFWIVQTPAVIVPASPIFGHGPAQFGGGAAAALGNSDVYESLGLPFGVYGTEGYIDNNWLSIWGEYGTVGIFLFLWAYIALFRAAMKLYRESDDPYTRAFALSYAAMTIAIALNAFLATFLEVRTLAPYLWAFGGMIFVLAEREKIEL
ncbi:MAG: O-antigen ligase family protein [bacterium]|nr:O-antigen ligase family protein [bacterium]